MGDIVPFAAPHGGKSYHVELALLKGRKRRQWAVVERMTDGSEHYLAAAGGRKREAEYMANLMTRIEVENEQTRRAFAAHPLGQFILSMSPEQRDVLSKFLQYEKRLREG